MRWHLSSILASLPVRRRICPMDIGTMWLPDGRDRMRKKPDRRRRREGTLRVWMLRKFLSMRMTAGCRWATHMTGGFPERNMRSSTLQKNNRRCCRELFWRTADLKRRNRFTVMRRWNASKRSETVLRKQKTEFLFEKQEHRSR